MTGPQEPAHWTQSGKEIPTGIKLQREQQRLVLTWPGGDEQTLDAPALRRNCPCATCRTERENQSQAPATQLRILSGGGDIQLVSAELVGRYAVKLIWSDGHDTGIFDFRYLRSLGRPDS